MQRENPTRWTTLRIPIPERAALAYWRWRRISRDKTRISEKLPPPLIPHKKKTAPADISSNSFHPKERCAITQSLWLFCSRTDAKRAFLLSSLLSVLKQIESVASGGRDSDRDGTALLFLLRLVPTLVCVCVCHSIPYQVRQSTAIKQATSRKRDEMEKNPIALFMTPLCRTDARWQLCERLSFAVCSRRRRWGCLPDPLLLVLPRLGKLSRRFVDIVRTDRDVTKDDKMLWNVDDVTRWWSIVWR